MLALLPGQCLVYVCLLLVLIVPQLFACTLLPDALILVTLSYHSLFPSALIFNMRLFFYLLIFLVFSLQYTLH